MTDTILLSTAGAIEVEPEPHRLYPPVTSILQHRALKQGGQSREVRHWIEEGRLQPAHLSRAALARISQRPGIYQHVYFLADPQSQEIRFGITPAAYRAAVKVMQRRVLKRSTAERLRTEWAKEGSPR